MRSRKKASPVPVRRMPPESLSPAMVPRFMADPQVGLVFSRQSVTCAPADGSSDASARPAAAIGFVSRITVVTPAG